jgi:hypothetical protein
MFWAKTDRPLLERAIGRVESGESSGIVVSRLDRFGRSLLDGLAGSTGSTRWRHVRGGRGWRRPLDGHRQAGAAPDAVTWRVGAGSGALGVAYGAGAGDRTGRACRSGADRISPPRRWTART